MSDGNAKAALALGAGLVAGAAIGWWLHGDVPGESGDGDKGRANGRGHVGTRGECRTQWRRGAIVAAARTKVQLAPRRHGQPRHGQGRGAAWPWRGDSSR